MRISIKTLSIFGFLGLLLWLSPATATVQAETPDKLIEKADKFWPQRADIPTVAKAAEFYRQALKIDPNNYEANWKLARSLIWMAEHKDQKKERAFRKKTSEEAVERAKKAVELQPNDPAGHFFLALAYGYYGEANGIMDTLFLLTPAENELKKVMELDPDFLCGGAYVAYGWGYHFLPGHRDKAVEYFKKGIKLCPNVFGPHLFLAQTYIKMGKKEEARALLNQILAGPTAPDWAPEYEEWKEEAVYYMIKVEEMD